ncbi:isocitrate lyase/phosphoenolpyruvate mutase family protein [Saccharothrix luteola]|uniref:isocitrate lyase/phosphoenolpyruvate mutase family protein n=1 Tax=Saccharothrix luteola TaxID=2893018 RepID=UPI001E5C916E|nr:isocitrate lyase/phosphoenolpyruvate mutase family protein [Saccharothrix luteola]MCC8250107.1 isocitrate lyase/phosphoenolpyruvate mutase family protein [Saccharothrix luteola]
MIRGLHPSFRDVLARGGLVKVAGAHNALGAVLAERAGFHAVWSSSFEVSAARCLPDASLLTMTDYLEAAVHMQRAVGVPVVADCDSGFGNELNFAHLVHEYEASGITAVCVEDKLFPKMNSFVGEDQRLVDAEVFARRIAVAKQAQRGEDFLVIARTEAFIAGLGLEEALRRCHTYADAGADAVLVHSKQSTEVEVAAFLARWVRDVPVAVVPTTYPAWHAEDAHRAGAAIVIYANQGLRAQVLALRHTFGEIVRAGHTAGVESGIATLDDIFTLQGLEAWRKLAR